MDLASNFLNFRKGFFSVGGFNWAGNEFELCAEHGMTLDGVKCRNSDGTFEFETRVIDHPDNRLLYMEFNEYPFIDSKTLRYRPVGKNRKSSWFKGLLLVDYNLIYNPKEEITEHRQEFNADTLVCAKNISETFLLEVCQRLKFDNFVMSTTAEEYGVSNTALDHYDWGIGSVHYKRKAHFEIGSGGCAEKADALVLECGFDKSLNRLNCILLISMMLFPQ
eukprot:sb/3469822/